MIWDMGISAPLTKSVLETPHLDELCANGVRFTDAHSSSAVCTPSRYSILTGRHNWRSRLKSYVVGDIVHQSIDGSLSIRRGNFKLELCQGSGGWSEPVSGKFDPELPRFQLYDLSQDIGERRNVIEEYPELARELKRTLKAYVENGRSTQGEVQSNNGQRIWETIAWLDEEDDEL